MGVDISSNLIKIAQDNVPGVPFELIDSKAPFANIKKELFDVITMNYVLCVLPKEEEIQKIISGAHTSLHK